MSVFKPNFFACLFLLCLQTTAMAQVVVEDQGVSLSYDELQYIVSQWTPPMKQAAANDEGDRLELVNKVLSIKKIAREADKLPADSDAYWRLQTDIMNMKRKAVLSEYISSLKVPDMSALAKERYETEKEKYARVEERRISSHILFACAPGECSRVDTKVEAQIVLNELRAGADFAEMVQVHSDDPGTKVKGGKFDKWMRMGESGVAGPYSEGLFQIDNEGDYSELVSTQFGIHILRLDGVEEEHFLPYKDVKARIIADLETEYRKLSITEFNRSFNMTSDVKIDGKAMDSIFAPYQTKGE